MDLRELLPEHVADVLNKWGITRLFPPQEEVAKRGLVTSGNFVLASPTASGKTLAAEMAMVNDLLKGGKAVYVVPLRAIASEKYNSFKGRYGSLGFSVRVSVGDYDSSEEPLGRHDLIITTYEKLDSILRHGPSWISALTTVVFDEIHFVHDAERGPTIEMTIAKLMDANPSVRRIALSATIGNLEEISSWLEAEPVAVGWRPVPLRVGAYAYGVGRILWSDRGDEKIHKATGIPEVDLALRTIASGGQAIVFYPTRRSAVAGASKIARAISSTLVRFDREAAQSLAESILKEEPQSRVIERLAEVVRRGAAFHHAGLSHGARVKIEEAFRRGILLAIAATPTLAAGVNLPARTVIIKSHKRYDRTKGRSAPISVMEFHQMAGRAGRPGFDEIGEAIVLASSRREAEELLTIYAADNLEPITSKLDDPSKFRTHLLSLIVLRSPVKPSDLADFVKKTLLYIERGEHAVSGLIPSSLDFLIREGFVESTSGGRLAATRFGVRTSQLYIDPVSAVMMARGLERMPSVGEGELEISVLHLIGLLPDMYRVAIRARESERIEEILEELEPLLPPEELPIEIAVNWFSAVKMAAVLRAWLNEAPEALIEETYGVEPGDLRSFTEVATWLSYAFSEIARLFGKVREARYLRQLSARMKVGVKPELLQLTAVLGVGRRRARALYEAGYRTLSDLASADPKRLQRIPGIGSKLAENIIREAKALLER
ncbi:MAG TPA: DEAD/DEAH box helicase [Candidatus Korarchaeota archaeon]|nr:DEAD/DEAH box helicase [Candidatus Korarchaeota archaeon]